MRRSLIVDMGMRVVVPMGMNMGMAMIIVVKVGVRRGGNHARDVIL